MKKCIITGSNGYLGLFLVSEFKKLGWEVLELSSTYRNNQIEFQLNNLNNINKEIFRDCNLLIHTSYDFAINEKNFDKNHNVLGSIKLFEMAKSMNVEKIINISTISAFKNSKSLYGCIKFEIEERSRKFNVINLRPGLFFGKNSKIIKKIENICRIFPIIPMLGNGDFKLHLTNYHDLFQFILEIYEDKNIDSSKILYPCTYEHITFKELVMIISKNKKVLPLPLFLIFFVLKIFSTLRLKLPLDLDNLKGLVYYNDEIDFRWNKKYKTKFRSID